MADNHDDFCMLTILDCPHRGIESVISIKRTKNWKALDFAMDDPKLQAWRSPVQQELEGLLSELAALNERIAELVRQGHRGHALNVLTAQALSLAGQIDELRCLLVVPKPSRFTRREPSNYP